ncbi:MAG: metallophosphoesterase [Clostridia bacterium]|nr:metallophosphoesterase [Clostridia bacterium]
MKFLLFSDFHYYPDYFFGGTFEKLHQIQKRAEDENVEFIIHAGDMTHGASLHPDFVKEYNDFHIPSYNCLGNHDTDHTALEETVKLYNMPGDYYYFDVNGFRMIVLNPNMIKLDGQYIKYSMGNYFAHEAKRDWIDPKQLLWLKNTIASSEYPCILISHASFERETGGIQNFEEVRNVINDANSIKPHSVVMCINGHYHRDFLRILDGVAYFDVNSSSFDWLPKEHDLYPKDETDKIVYMNHCVHYNDPLSAVVTIENTGCGIKIDIKGSESTFYRGITREMTGNVKCDDSGRPCTAKIMSANITLG